MNDKANKRALIIVDVQNDFCSGGALAIARGDEVIAPLNHLAQEFLARGDSVVKSRDWHPAVTKHFIEYGGVWQPHCIAGTFGAEFHRELINDPRIYIVSKGLGDEDNYSAFDGTGLSDFLRRRNVEEIHVGGLATDYCVKQTVLDGLKAGFKTFASTNAMRAVNLQPGDDARAIAEMQAAGAILLSDCG